MTVEMCSWCPRTASGYVEVREGRWVNNKRGGKDYVGASYVGACRPCALRLGVKLEKEPDDIYQHGEIADRGR